MDKIKNNLNKLLKPFFKIADKCFLIEAAYVFGSYAVNEQTEYSDIDLAIVSDDFRLFDDEAVMMVLSRIARFTNSKIEPVVFTEAEINNPLLGTLTWEVVNNGIKIR